MAKSSILEMGQWDSGILTQPYRGDLHFLLRRNMSVISCERRNCLSRSSNTIILSTFIDPFFSFSFFSCTRHFPVILRMVVGTAGRRSLTTTPPPLTPPTFLSRFALFFYFFRLLAPGPRRSIKHSEAEE
ncbi:hypothetical protein Aperf_G00000096767 [Anoplocephala perfoliata]